MKTTNKKTLVKPTAKAKAKSKGDDPSVVVELLGQILQELREVNEHLQDMEYSRALLSSTRAEQDDEDPDDTDSDDTDGENQPR